MNKIILFFLLIFLLIGCEKNDNSTLIGWTEIDFKSNYTIQVPKTYLGYGMDGFEGNTFSKSSPDGKIQLSYLYCNSLSCFDFGNSLEFPIPTSIQIQNNYSEIVTLNQIEYFQQNSQTTGIFYFSKRDTANGRLYWKDNGTFKDALEVEFNIAKLETVDKIIGTIRRK
jgi:hypothetical protein